MNEITAYLLLSFAIAVLVSVFYWHVVHRVLAQHLLYRLFARRDEVREMRTGVGVADEEPLRQVELFVSGTIAAAPRIGLWEFLRFYARPRKDAEAPEVVRLPDQRVEEVVRLTVRDALTLMALNSPLLVAVAGVASLFLWVSGRISRSKVYAEGRRFIDGLPSNSPLPA